MPLDTRAMNSLLSAVARSGGLAATRAAFERARAACGGLAPDGNTFAALVTAAVREGEHTEALRLVEARTHLDESALSCADGPLMAAIVRGL